MTNWRGLNAFQASHKIRLDSISSILENYVDGRSPAEGVSWLIADIQHYCDANNLNFKEILELANDEYKDDLKDL